MTKQRFLAVAAAAGFLAAPAAFADSTIDLDPYWKWSKIERTAASGDRAEADSRMPTQPSPVADPGAFHY